MKKSIKVLSLLSAMVAMSFSLMFITSCDDGDDDNIDQEPPTANPVVNVQVACTIDLNDVYYDFYNVSMTYCDEDGSFKTVPVNKNEMLGVKYDVEKVPAVISCKLEGILKDSLPEIDTTKVYNLSNKSYVQFAEIKKDGSLNSLKSMSSSYNFNLKGGKLSEYISKNDTVTLLSTTYEWKK